MGGTQEGGVITAFGGVITVTSWIAFTSCVAGLSIGRILQEPGQPRKNAHLHIIKILTTWLTFLGHIKSQLGPKTSESWIFRCVVL